MSKREKRLTKRERQALVGKGPTGARKEKTKHIHCISCGRHLEPEEFDKKPATARWLTCDHGSKFAACVACTVDAKERIAEHDRTGSAPRIAAVWH